MEKKKGSKPEKGKKSVLYQIANSGPVQLVRGAGRFISGATYTLGHALKGGDYLLRRGVGVVKGVGHGIDYTIGTPLSSAGRYFERKVKERDEKRIVLRKRDLALLKRLNPEQKAEFLEHLVESSDEEIEVPVSKVKGWESEYAHGRETSLDRYLARRKRKYEMAAVFLLFAAMTVSTFSITGYSIAALSEGQYQFGALVAVMFVLLALVAFSRQ